MKSCEIIDRLEGTLDEMFRDYQGDMNIESGDLCPELTVKLDLAIHRLADVIQMCMTWQKDNCPFFEYNQTYAPDTDTTFIMKDTNVHLADGSGDYMTVKREVVGFYSGRPTEEHFNEYKDAGTVANY